MNHRNRKDQGFTLIELLIVIAIIGILAAVLIPNLLGSRNQAFDTGAMNCGKAIQSAQTSFYGKQFRYATNPAELLTAIGEELLEPCFALSNFPAGEGIRLGPDAPSDVSSDGDLMLTSTDYDSDALGFEVFVWDQRGSTIYSVTETEVRAVEATTGGGGPIGVM